ncbi:glycosyltransferase family 2 protein [Georgenia sp. AZ-5]|uniref:glycosyltransferase family 2 protein n=1 Tax=Georgenia sp. AZ-5 TaxID=3367526 RepID=UPI0037548D1F
MTPTSIAVVMPAYNEADGIGSFLTELHESLAEYETTFVVVDDASKDDTAGAVEACARTGVPVTVHRNEANSGHGPSTLRALRAGVALQTDLVVAVDGDGQFTGADVARVVAAALERGVEIAEGVRRHREDPVFRRATTVTTRALVGVRCHHLPRDANTPLRVYRTSTLRRLLDVVPPNAITPNLLISAITRRWDLTIREVEVACLPRRGATEAGTTWGQRRRSLPSKRFLMFCRDAAIEWVSTSPRRAA